VVAALDLHAANYSTVLRALRAAPQEKSEGAALAFLRAFR
jgi:hypothetical protein